MPFCKTCGEWSYGDGHRCPPKWNVWPEGSEEGLEVKHAYEVFADDANSAALKFADEHSDDGPIEDDVFVRAVGTDGPAECFALDHSYQLVYEAKPRKPKP